MSYESVGTSIESTKVAESSLPITFFVSKSVILHYVQMAQGSLKTLHGNSDSVCRQVRNSYLVTAEYPVRCSVQTSFQIPINRQQK